MASPRLKKKITTASSSSERSDTVKKPPTLVEVRRIVYDYMMTPGNGAIVKQTILDVGATRLTDMDPAVYSKFLRILNGRIEE